jgi:hypothetical protein
MTGRSLPGLRETKSGACLAAESPDFALLNPGYLRF